jgi:hypothetical protein
MARQQSRAADLAKEYETLAGKAKKTKEEEERLKTVMEDLKKIYPDLTDEMIRQKGASGELAVEVEKLGRARLQEAIDAQDLYMSQLNQKKRRHEDAIATYEGNLTIARDTPSLAPQAAAIEAEIAMLKNAKADVDKLLTDAGKVRLELIADRNALDAPPPKADDDDDATTTTTATTTTAAAAAKPKSQGARLRELDADYKAQKALADKYGGDIYAVELKWQTEREKLLETFVREDMAGGKEFEGSLESGLVGWKTKIGDELEQTKKKIEALSAEPVTWNFEAQVNFMAGKGVSLEDAYKSIEAAARSAADTELAAMQEKSALLEGINQKLADRNLSEEAANDLALFAAQVGGELAEAENRRAEALALEDQASTALFNIDMERLKQTAELSLAGIEAAIAAMEGLGRFKDEADKKAEKRRLITEAQLDLEDQLIALEKEAALAGGAELESLEAQIEALKDEIKELKEAAGDANEEVEGFSSKMEKWLEDLRQPHSFPLRRPHGRNYGRHKHRSGEQSPRV